jgi:hypothetical protein
MTRVDIQHWLNYLRLVSQIPVSRSLFRFCAPLAALAPHALSAWQPGTYPPAPARMHSRGFEVNHLSRNDVLGFWHAVYQASEGYEKRIGWTGSLAGNPGTVSRVFADDVERRINFFRAMCGVPANARVNSGSTVVIDPADPHKPAPSTRKSDAAQAAAMMLFRNYNPSTGTDPAIDHDPKPSLAGWTPAAWNANANGNLAFGLFGPGAITEYMMEEVVSGTATSAWNSLVGHRRWCLVPDATDFATGDQPGGSPLQPPTNVLYITQSPGEEIADATPGFVCYPSPGFFPAPVNSRFWSLGREGADFSKAKVSMKDSGGRPVTIAAVRNNATYGNPAVIWEVAGPAAAKFVAADQTFHVTVTGIQGAGIPSSHTYSVTLINPDRITSNQTLTGSALVNATSTATYGFTPPADCEAVRITTFQRKPATWKEGAEKSPKPKVIGRTSSKYKLLTSSSDKGSLGALSKNRSFRLTFPSIYDKLARGVPDQSFEIDRLILPKSKARLEFAFRRGYMTKGSVLVTELSKDGGATWKQFGKPITGVSDTKYDETSSRAAVSISSSGQPIRVRFRYYAKKGQPIYTHEAAPKSPTGIFIDDVAFKNCDWLEPRKTTVLPNTASSFVFGKSTAGAPLVKGDRWMLALGTRLGGRWFPYGPVKAVTVK